MTQTLQFSKFHGLGNDFILFDAVNQRIDIEELRKETPLLCDRHFGIGADGVAAVVSSDSCDIRMVLFNADGSEPEMCGNGLRCLARFAYEQRLVEKDVFSVETPAGKMVVVLIIEEGRVKAVEVDMGAPKVKNTGDDPVTTIEIPFENQHLVTHCVSMGNPHAVVFVEDLADVDLVEMGTVVQADDQFPDGVNVELVQLHSEKQVSVKVLERGVGPTLACATGACAVVVAGNVAKLLQSKVAVDLPGGRLIVEWQSSDSHVIVTGPAKRVFTGEVVL